MKLVVLKFNEQSTQLTPAYETQDCFLIRLGLDGRRIEITESLGELIIRCPDGTLTILPRTNNAIAIRTRRR